MTKKSIEDRKETISALMYDMKTIEEKLNGLEADLKDLYKEIEHYDIDDFEFSRDQLWWLQSIDDGLDAIETIRWLIYELEELHKELIPELKAKDIVKEL